jgi:hypothetical protein
MFRQQLREFHMFCIGLISVSLCYSFRQQDEELDELSASVERIGGVGLTIHEELSGQVRGVMDKVQSWQSCAGTVTGMRVLTVLQERILNDLSLEMETTSNRLDFVQVCSFGNLGSVRMPTCF